MLIHDFTFAKVHILEEQRIGMIEWFGKCTSDEYRSTFIKLLEIQKENKLTRYLSDITKQHVVSPEDRKWFETVAMPQAVQQGLKVAAVVFDGNVFKKYYLNVILAATNKFGLPLKVFTDLEEAIAWLASKS